MDEDVEDRVGCIPYSIESVGSIRVTGATGDSRCCAGARLRPFAKIQAALEARCPDLVDHHRWQQAVTDARRFLETWGARAAELGCVRQMGGRRLKITQGGKHARVVFTDHNGKRHSLLLPQGSGADPRAHVNRRLQLRRMLTDSTKDKATR
jgi:hypothetical protein